MKISTDVVLSSVFTCILWLLVCPQGGKCHVQYQCIHVGQFKTNRKEEELNPLGGLHITYPTGFN